MTDETLHHIARADGTRLAALHRPGREATIVFLPGLRSDMRGDKAGALSRFAAGRGQACLRLDYSGHGESGGAFEAGGIASWEADALAVIDALAPGPLVLVGSSMGGWIGLLLARRLGDRVRGYVGLAPAPDFTDTISGWLDSSQYAALARGETVLLPGEPDPLPLTQRFLDEGSACRLLDRPIGLACPIRLLHGQLDNVVPWDVSVRIADRVETADCRIVLIKDGDHRLSRPQDLAVLIETVSGLL